MRVLDRHPGGQCEENPSLLSVIQGNLDLSSFLFRPLCPLVLLPFSFSDFWRSWVSREQRSGGEQRLKAKTSLTNPVPFATASLHVCMDQSQSQLSGEETAVFRQDTCAHAFSLGFFVLTIFVCTAGCRRSTETGVNAAIALHSQGLERHGNKL